VPADLRRLLLLPLLIAALFAAPSAASAAGALDLNGSKQYLDAGTDPTANNAAYSRTWEVWVKTPPVSPTGAGETIVSRYHNDDDQEPWSLDILNTGKPRIFIQNDLVSYGARSATVRVDDNQWHHVAAVYVPSQRLDIYVDGVQVNDPALVGSILPDLDTAPSVHIRVGITDYDGAPGDHLYRSFTGQIDGLRYSKVARFGPTETFTPSHCPVADADTIGLWNFEGNSTASEGMTTAPGSLINGATLGAGLGCPGDALRFDGVNDRVSAPVDPSAADTATARTWEAWVKTTSNEHQVIIGLYQPLGDDDPWALDMEDGIARIHVASGTTHGARYASKTINDGTWHHVAAVWVPSSRLDLYIDGVKSNGPLGGGGAGETVPASFANAPDAGISIGAGLDHDDGQPDDFFDGDLDSVRYSEGARYTANFTPKTCWDVDPDTIALWTFSEAGGTTTASIGQLEADATLVDGVDWVKGLGCDPEPDPETGGSALDFSGASQYVDAGTDPTGSATTTARTWEAWVKVPATVTGSTQRTIMARYQNAVGKEPWLMDLANGTPRMFIQNGATSTSARTAAQTINDGQWHHLAAVWVPSTRLDFYIDGKLSNGPLTNSAVGVILSSLDLGTGITIRLGVRTPTAQPFTGSIDGVRYSTGALYSVPPITTPPTPAFVPDLHPDADPVSTIGLWNFDEGSGTTTAVAGQMTAAATLVNGPTWTTGPA
jgi:hypothetical protein